MSQMTKDMSDKEAQNTDLQQQLEQLRAEKQQLTQQLEMVVAR